MECVTVFFARAPLTSVQNCADASARRTRRAAEIAHEQTIRAAERYARRESRQRICGRGRRMLVTREAN